MLDLHKLGLVQSNFAAAALSGCLALGCASSEGAPAGTSSQGGGTSSGGSGGVKASGGVGGAGATGSGGQDAGSGGSGGTLLIDAGKKPPVVGIPQTCA